MSSGILCQHIDTAIRKLFSVAFAVAFLIQLETSNFNDVDVTSGVSATYFAPGPSQRLHHAEFEKFLIMEMMRLDWIGVVTGTRRSIYA